MRLAAPRSWRRGAYRLAAMFRQGYKHRTGLARLTATPFVSWSARLGHPGLALGESVFLGDDVVVFSADGSGSVEVGRGSCLHHGVIVETSAGGVVSVGVNTHIQARCQLAAALGSIRIGSDVQIAPACGFYPYSHGMALGRPMREQALTSKGDITVGDDVWIGYGAVILEDVRIGDGAVVAAGAVVRSDVPDFAIVAGVPARVVGSRKS